MCGQVIGASLDSQISSRYKKCTVISSSFVVCLREKIQRNPRNDSALLRDRRKKMSNLILQLISSVERKKDPPLLERKTRHAGFQQSADGGSDRSRLDERVEASGILSRRTLQRDPTDPRLPRKRLSTWRRLTGGNSTRGCASVGRLHARTHAHKKTYTGEKLSLSLDVDPQRHVERCNALSGRNIFRRAEGKERQCDASFHAPGIEVLAVRGSGLERSNCRAGLTRRLTLS